MKLILVLLLSISLICSSDADMCEAVSDLVNKLLYESEEEFREEAALYGSDKGVDAAMKLRVCANGFLDEERPAYYDLVEDLLSHCSFK
uniref:Uncharacterized protein n=1 Tax=Sphaerodactylus townsendi TaxID=933632 RepID=A0ACB8G222_9SAUR